jgi:alpha-mannosidase
MEANTKSVLTRVGRLLPFLAGIMLAASILSLAFPSEALRVRPNAPMRGAQAHAGDATKPTLWLIPHTHWEGAVFKTREEYLESGLPHILQALHLLAKDPDYTFVLDQVAYVRPFLERYPEAAPEFRRFVREGRLELVGGNDVMLDVNMPSGESWVRQVLYGKGYYKRELGANITVGWALDTFGHHAQMPQLLKLAGYKSYWFQRGVPGNSTPSEFLWQGIDGTRIPAFWLPLGYGLFYPSPANADEFTAYARGVWQALGHYSHWPNRVALAGADVVNPEAILPVMVHTFDREANQPFTIRFAVPTDFEAVVGKRPSEPVITGEMNPVFQGIYSSRIELKEHLRNAERILTTAEKVAALDSWLGIKTPPENFSRAWEPVLFNEAHDLISGDMVDKVYVNTIDRYRFSYALGKEVVDDSLNALAGHIDTRAHGNLSGESIPILVFNSLGWSRTDVAMTRIGFTQAGVTAIRLLDPSGQEIPVQMMHSEHYSGGGIEDADIAFVARDVPALGYAIYEAVPERTSAKFHAGEPTGVSAEQTASTDHEDLGSIENGYYRATFNLWTGAMIKLVVKEQTGSWNALGEARGNVVAEEQDGGDLWELYGTLNGARLTAMRRKSGLPLPDRSHFSDEWVGGNGATTIGPVFSEFHISHPFGSGTFATTVRLYHGIRRVDIQTDLVNDNKFVRYRLLFPTSIADGSRYDEIPFGSIQRPTDQEFPAQNWIDWSNGTRGVALINRGLPGNNITRGTLLLSLVRSATISAYPFVGGYEPGESSELGLELGVRRKFDYALVPHAGDWRTAHICRAGLEFNNPFIVRVVSSHSGSLPARWGLARISPSNVVMSAFKPSQRGTVVIRVYEAGGQGIEGARVTLQPSVTRVDECNLLEEPVHRTNLAQNTFTFNLRPYQIETFCIQRSGEGL